MLLLLQIVVKRPAFEKVPLYSMSDWTGAVACESPITNLELSGPLYPKLSVCLRVLC